MGFFFFILGILAAIAAVLGGGVMCGMHAGLDVADKFDVENEHLYFALMASGMTLGGFIVFATFIFFGLVGLSIIVCLSYVRLYAINKSYCRATTTLSRSAW